MGDHAHQMSVENAPADEWPLGNELERGGCSQLGISSTTDELSGRVRPNNSLIGPFVSTHSAKIAAMNQTNPARSEPNNRPTPAAASQIIEYRPAAERAADPMTRFLLGNLKLA